MVEHDIEWGEWRIDYVEYGQPNHDFEPILARGINSLCSIFQAKGYDEKRNLFYPDWPRDSDCFLSSALEKASNLVALTIMMDGT